jgi:S1-C subfamily serine protease
LRVDYASVLPPRRAPWGGRSSSIHAGVLVSEVIPGSPSDKAGLKANQDIISEVEGVEVNTPAEFYLEATKVAARKQLRVTLVIDAERGPGGPAGPSERKIVIEGEP